MIVASRSWLLEYKGSKFLGGPGIRICRVPNPAGQAPVYLYRYLVGVPFF